jgi:lipoate-protein ligase B
MARSDSFPLPVYYWDSTLGYAEAAQRQEAWVEQGKEALIFCEHPLTVTLGTGANGSDLTFPPRYYERLGVAVHRSPRGGKATVHGPGQLVCYPILNLRERNITIHAYLRFLEEIMLSMCTAYGVDARRIDGKAGAWVGEKKIGFIGVRVRRGIAFHGCSINVTSQQESFRLIVPCGMPNLQVTSLQECSQSAVSVWEAADIMTDIFFSKLPEPELTARSMSTQP